MHVLLRCTSVARTRRTTSRAYSRPSWTSRTVSSSSPSSFRQPIPTASWCNAKFNHDPPRQSSLPLPVASSAARAKASWRLSRRSMSSSGTKPLLFDVTSHKVICFLTWLFFFSNFPIIMERFSSPPGSPTLFKQPGFKSLFQEKVCNFSFFAII